MAFSRLFPAGYVFLSANGQDPAASGVVYFYVNNTTNLATVYTDVAGGTPSSNPLTLGSDGRLPNEIFTAATLRVKLTDSLGSTIYQKDDVQPGLAIGSAATSAALSASSGTSLIGHISTGTGSAARTVQAKLRDMITPLDFEGVGDGTTDDTTAIQNTINAATGKGPVDLLGKTWKVTTTLSLLSDVTIQNGKITFATAADDDVLFEAYGSVGTQYTLTAAPTKGATSVAVSSATGLAAGDFCYLVSTDNWCASESAKRGEWVRVLSVSGLTINLEQKVRMTYTAGHTMYKPTMLSNIVLQDLTLTGNGYAGSAAQYALRAYLCRDVHVNRCVADSFGYAAFSLETVVGGSVNDCIVTRSNFTTGAAYGVAITGGCDGVSVKGGRYGYHRHAVTVGGTTFTNYGIAITGVTTMACSDAGIDVHGGAMNVVVSGCSIDCYSSDATETGDGITAQGANISIVGNIIRGWTRDGILAQPLTSAPAADDAWNISGNILANPEGASGADSIVFSSEKGAGNSIRSLVISNNSIEAESATTGRGIVLLNSTGGGPIRSISINGNAIFCRDQGISITAVDLELVQDVAITGNTIQTNSAAVPVVELIANAGGTKYLSCVTLVGNVFRGGTYSVSLSNAPTRIVTAGNLYQGFATSATSGSFDAVDGTSYSA